MRAQVLVQLDAAPDTAIALIDDLAPAVDPLHIRVLADHPRYPVQSARQEDVITVEPSYDVSAALPKPLVDRIRLAMIGLTRPLERHLVLPNDRQRAIRAAGIHHQVLKVELASLSQDALDGPANESHLIERRRHDGEADPHSGLPRHGRGWSVRSPHACSHTGHAAPRPLALGTRTRSCERASRALLGR